MREQESSQAEGLHKVESVKPADSAGSAQPIRPHNTPNQARRGEEMSKEKGDQEEEVGEEEGAKVRGARAPRSPTKEEKEDHNKTHLPFRAWCPHCVRGKSVASPTFSKGRRGEE